MPLVSVIIPVHNGETHLAQCLASVRSQTLADFEAIVVDDASVDSSAAVAAEVAAVDPRFRVLDGPGVGSAGAARNAGLAVATGDYLAFLDADDLFAPTLLAELHAKAVADDADVVASKFTLLQQATGELSPANWSLRLEYLPHRRPFHPFEVADQLFFAVNPAAWNKLFRRRFVVEQGLQFQPLPRVNDAGFTYLALARASRITYLDRALVTYRTGTDTSLQATLDASPLAFVDALRGIRAGLEEAGLFVTYERGFVNLALSMALTNLKRPRSAEGFLAVHRALREEVFAELGVLGRPRSYFLRADLPQGLDDVMTLSPEAFLLQRARLATQDADQARAELRAALRTAAHQPVQHPDLGTVPASRHSDLGTVPASQSPDGGTVPASQDPDGGTVPASRDLVSVVIPVYNTELFLQQCLDSVLAQTGVDLEVICVDDGSTDGSPLLLDGYAARDPRVTVIHQANAGPAAARNTGLDVATGGFVCFVDSDDYWRGDQLAGLVERARRDDLDVLLFDAESQREPDVPDETWQHYESYYTRQVPDGIRSGPELVAELRAHYAYRASVCLLLARRHLLEERGLRFQPGIIHEDDLFTFRLLLDAARVTHDSTALLVRRVRPGSIVTTRTRADSARGYFVACLGMQRALAGRQWSDPRAAAALGGLVYRAFRSARADLIELPEDLVAPLRDIDPGPDAAALFLLLEQEWRDEQARRLLAKRLRHAEARRPARPAPFLTRVRRRLGRIIRQGR